ncbi:MAG: hypothetical protein CM15mP125_2870 [Gammaproteobacteria bacterium]|nr:MAG: hypothetical protein CM15mP125_2870 [Gammaproteobacteria bacterium]
MRGWPGPASKSRPGVIPTLPAKLLTATRLVRNFCRIETKPSFWWMAIAASLVAFVATAISFQAPFLQREHGLSVRDAALKFGAPLVTGSLGLSLVGTLPSGYGAITYRVAGYRLWDRQAVPAYAAAFFPRGPDCRFCPWGIGAVFHSVPLGLSKTIGQGVVATDLAPQLLQYS